MEAFLFNTLVGTLSKIAPISLGLFLVYLGLGLGIRGDKDKLKKARRWALSVYLVIMVVIVGGVFTNTTNTPKRSEGKVEISQPSIKGSKEVVEVTSLMERAKETNKDFEAKLWQGK